MIDVGRLQRILNDTTAILNKGEETQTYLEYLGIHEGLRSSPHFPDVAEWPSQHTVVDCAFVAVGVNKDLAAEHLQAFEQILAAFPNPAILREGPSYRYFTPYVGSELNALRFLALGHALGLWSVITPADLGVPDGLRSSLSLLGVLCMSGYPAHAIDEVRIAVC